MRIRKALQYYILVIVLGISALIEAVSGFVLWFALPYAGRRFASAEFWSLSRSTWTDLHDWAAVALVVIVLVHIGLHWKWIVTITRQIVRSWKKEFSPWRSMGAAGAVTSRSER